ncbi:MAG TPA: gamma-glutamyltransferase, partial [Coriobacteriia bacterium]
MVAAIAAGHPATVDAGIEILADGGSAADAAVAASLATCVAETVMTGLLGGGHAIYYDVRSGSVRNLDCFVAVPGLGVEPRRDVELLELEILFGAEFVHYAVGPASCGVPGLPAGLGVLHREHGRLPWPRLVEPALHLAREGVVFPPAHAACLAMLAPVMTMDEGARIYSPGGQLLQAGETLRQPGLVPALEALRDEGPRSLYEGSLADALLALMDERGGLITRGDLRAYDAQWSDPVEAASAGTRVLTRAGLAPVADALTRLPALRALSPGERAVAL